MTLLSTVIQRGTLAARPAATAVPVGTLYGVTDTGVEAIYRSTGAAWELMGMSTAGAADNAIPKTIVDAKGDIIAATAADTVSRLAVGTNDQALIADSAQATGLKYAGVVLQTLADAKGDMIAASAADTWAKVTVGTNDTALVADSAQSAGVKWAGVVLQSLADAKGDIIAATAADTWARVAVGATDGMALMVDSAQSAGIRWATANAYIKEGAGVVYAAYGNGDASDTTLSSFTTTNPDAISTASFNRARGVLFRLPRTLAVTDAYIVGTTLGSSGSMYKLGIYKASDNSQIWASSAFDTTAGDWTNLTGLSFTLDANTDYYLFTITTASSATNSAATWTSPSSTGLFGANSPFYTSTSQGYTKYVEYTVGTPGTLDATMPALSAQSTTTGTCLKTYLKGTAT